MLLHRLRDPRRPLVSEDRTVPRLDNGRRHNPPLEAKTRLPISPDSSKHLHRCSVCVCVDWQTVVLNVSLGLRTWTLLSLLTNPHGKAERGLFFFFFFWLDSMISKGNTRGVVYVSSPYQSHVQFAVFPSHRPYQMCVQKTNAVLADIDECSTFSRFSITQGKRGKKKDAIPLPRNRLAQPRRPRAQLATHNGSHLACDHSRRLL